MATSQESSGFAPLRHPLTVEELEREVAREDGVSPTAIPSLSPTRTTSQLPSGIPPRAASPPARSRSPLSAMSIGAASVRSDAETPNSDLTGETATELRPTTTADIEAQRPRDVYDRFSPSKKHWIVAIVSFSAFIGPVASSAFLPSITVMAEDLNTTPDVINYTVAIFIVAVGVAPIFWSPLSGFYGRRPVYLLSMPIMTVASIGVAQSNTVGQIIGTRILQGIGSSCVLSVGAGTVGDIYRPTERANAMSWFYSGVLIGPALAPALAGVFTEYTSITWRATQYFLCACSGFSVLVTALFLPETSHPPLPHEKAKAERQKKFVMYWFNPLRSLGLLRYPNIVTTTISSCCVMVELYCIMVPLATIFQDRYNLHNIALAGTIYLANGFGTLLGSRFIGPYADRVVKKWIKKRGYRRPEDRLRAALWGAGVISPASCLAYGWVLWANKGGLAPPIVMLVINGIGTQVSLTPVNTYLVDAAQSRSAESIAVNNFFRYLFAAAASAFVLPMINKIGLGWTMTFATAIAVLGFVMILVTMWYGEGWREAAARSIADAKGEKEQVVDGGRAPDSAAAVADAEADGEITVTESEKAGSEKQRRSSNQSSHSHHEEKEHGEPTNLPATLGRSRTRAGTGLDRARSRGNGTALNRARSRAGSTASMPTVGEVLQRTVSLSGGSVHGGG